MSYILIVDTGGGTQGMVTSRSQRVIEGMNVKIELSSYQNKGTPKACYVVNSVMIVNLKNGKEIQLLMNNATLVEEEERNP